MKQKKNILFLSWGEDIVANPILRNQFLELPLQWPKDGYQVFQYSFIPISRSFLKSPLKWGEKLQEYRKELETVGVNTSYHLIPAPANWLYTKWWQFFFFHFFFSVIRLFLLLAINKMDTIHCRGYHSTNIVLVLRKIFNFKYKVIFDARGLFPLEGQYLGKIKGTLWKRIEKYNAENADLVLGVSEPHTEFYQEHYKVKKALTLYTTVNTDIFKPNQEFRDYTRKRFNIKDDETVFAYIGQLDNNGWHRIQTLKNLFKSIKEIVPSSKLMVITKSNHAKILSTFKGYEDSLILTSTNNPTESSEVLNGADFSVMTYKENNSPIEAKIAKTVVASKSGEYLSIGLPLIVNNSLKGISSLIEKYRIGITYNINNEVEVKEKLNKFDRSDCIVRCTQVTEELFNISNNIKLLNSQFPPK